MTAFLFFFLAFSVFAQEFQYELEGSFEAPEEVTVNYNIRWNESASAIQGIYRDNFFVKKGPQTVTGTATPDGRSMHIILPEEVNGVRSIRFKTTQTGTGNVSVPITTTMLDNVGGTTGKRSDFALLTPHTFGEAEEENACTVGFGALTGFCGYYTGMITEISDNNFRCDLLSGGQPILELASDTFFRLHLTNLPIHTIGAFIPSPQSDAINVTARECGPLSGTTFIPDNCKTQNLSGIFFNQASNITFTGTYSITDDVTADTCSYSLSITRERTF